MVRRSRSQSNYIGSKSMINKCLKKSTSAELKIAIELNGLFTWNQNRYNAPG